MVKKNIQNYQLERNDKTGCFLTIIFQNQQTHLSEKIFLLLPNLSVISLLNETNLETERSIRYLSFTFIL